MVLTQAIIMTICKAFINVEVYGKARRFNKVIDYREHLLNRLDKERAKLEQLKANLKVYETKNELVKESTRVDDIAALRELRAELSYYKTLIDIPDEVKTYIKK